MTYPRVPLGDLIAPAQVRRAGDETLPILSMTMHHGLVDQESKFKKRVASADLSQYKVISRDQLVVGFPIDEGVLGFQNLYERAIVSPAYGVWDVTRPKIIDRDYLQRFLRSPEALTYFRSRLQGTTARRRSLPSRTFLELSVPLPALDEQWRILNILDHADTLRAKRREAIARLDELTRSIFIDMFGDPSRPLPQNKSLRLGELTEISSGSTPSRAVPENYGGVIPWVKTTEVINGDIFNTEERVTEEGLRAGRLKLYPTDSLIIAMYGQGATRGRVARLRVPATTNQACAVLAPSDKYLPEFMFEQLRLSYDRLRSQGQGGNQPNLSGRIISDFPVILPSIENQREFARIGQEIERTRQRFRASELELENLFQSLHARAFRNAL